ncbi:MAG: ThiF family adenylyltransferase [Candidatus Woesearchaeota archaeon]
MVDEIYDRNIGVWTEKVQEKLKKTTVGVAGLGGAGSSLLDILARNGIGRFKIADPDSFDISNIQRQLNATHKAFGKNKAAVTKERILDINPKLHVASYEEGITLDNIDDFLDDCNFVHDAIEHYKPELKITFHRKAREKGLIITSSFVVAGGMCTLAFHPQGMGFEEYFEYANNVENWKLKHNKIVKKDPDYIDRDFFLDRVSKGVVPTSADGAYLTGIVVAGTYKRLIMEKEVAYAPKAIRLDILDDDMYQKAIVD